MSETINTAQHSTLEDYVMAKLDAAKKNRRPLEAKWRQNLSDYHPYVDPFHEWIDQDGTPCQPSGSESLKICIGKNKAVTAKAVISDTQFKGGRVQFMLAPDDDEAFYSPAQPDPLGEPMAGGEAGMGMDPEAMSPDQQVTTRHMKDVINVDEVLIHRQLELCDGVEELSSCILYAALYGITFTKRYMRQYRHRAAKEVAPGVLSVVEEIEEHPAIERKSPWRMLWDLESGLSVREGSMVAEMDDISLSDLAALARDPAYDAEAIREIIKGRVDAMNSDQTIDRTADNPRREQIEVFERTVKIYEVWLEAPERLMRHHESKRGKPDTQSPEPPVETSQQEAADPLTFHDMADAMVMIVDGGTSNRKIIRFERVEKWDRPFYDAMWEEVPDDTATIGVLDNLHQLQNVITRTVNALVENAEATANTMGFWKPELLADKNLKKMTTGEWQALSEDCKDARQAVQQMTLLDTTGSLREVIDMMMNFGDLFSHIPKAEQGQQEQTAQTAFELGQRLERAGKYLGDVIRNIDRMIEDIVRDFYFYNLLDPERVTSRRYRVKALGFATFEDKQKKITSLIQALNMALQNPTLEAITRVRYLWEEFLKLLDLDALEILKSPAEMREEAAERQAAMSASPPSDPAEQAKQAALILSLQAAAREKEASAALKQAKAQEATRKVIREDAKAAAEMDRQAIVDVPPPVVVPPPRPEPALI